MRKWTKITKTYWCESKSKYSNLQLNDKNIEASEGQMQEDANLEEDDLLDEECEVCENRKDNGECST